MVKHKNRSSSAKNSSTKKQRNKQYPKINKNLLLAVLFVLPLVIAISLYFTRTSDYIGPQLPPPPSDALYKQSNQPINARVDDLLARMTLEEKIGQMSLVDKKSLKKLEDIKNYSLGGILSGAGAKPKVNTPQGWLEMVNEMKSQAMSSRLGIPILYGVDANHGHANMLGATVFPHAIGLGATNNNELVKEVAEATADEISATGINWSYSPSLDAPKDIRWGRVYEAFSDSPAINASLGSSYVAGTQNPYPNSSYILGSAKHYVGTGAMVWGESNHKVFKIDQGKTIANEAALNSEYLPPFKAAVDAGVASVMVALNEWGNERIIDSKYLITDKLKTELGFKGFVVSDWYGVYEYAKTNKYNANVSAINAGLDMAMLPYDYSEFLKQVRAAVQRGEISQSRIDDAVSRILYQKFKAGLFDTTSTEVSLQSIGLESHRQLARRAVASSAVLLKNNGSLVPISAQTESIHVAGSGANNIGRQSGAWTIEWQGVDGNWMPGGTSILEGIKQATKGKSTVVYDLDGNFDAKSSKAKVGIAIVSEKPYAEGWGDNPNPTIDASDLQAIENLKQSSEKVIVILLSGRPLLISDKINTWDAAIAAWLPGSEGAGIADVLFGKQPFNAKLPITWPANLQQIPVEANGTTANKTAPLFTRGYGL